jgi:hypothetical protein
MKIISYRFMEAKGIENMQCITLLEKVNDKTGQEQFLGTRIVQSFHSPIN